MLHLIFICENQFDPRELSALGHRFARFVVNIVSIYYFFCISDFPRKFGRPIDEKAMLCGFALVILCSIFVPTSKQSSSLCEDYEIIYSHESTICEEVEHWETVFGGVS